ncbi:MAG: HAD family hydrolase [Muribaculaceae bacterium]|nr:HAD family hydrolase [Muribaculaceae bacterium]
MSAVFFNLDALIDYNDLFVEAMSKTVTSFSKEPIDPDLVAATSGTSIREALQLLTGADQEKFLVEAQEIYFKKFTDLTIKKGKLRDGALDVLRALQKKGVKIGYYTNRPGETLEQVVNHFSLQQFSEVFIAEDESEARPAPDMLEFLIEQLGAEEDKQFIVCAVALDIEMGIRAEIPTVAFSNGSNTARVLSAFCTDFIIEHLAELLPLVG